MIFKTLFSIALLILICTNCSDKTSSEKSKQTLCAGYSWGDVEALVEPHISEDLYVSLVMQAQSSEYKVSAAADHAIGLSNSYPDSVLIILSKLKKLNC